MITFAAPGYSVPADFAAWKTQHNKVYASPVEETLRHSNWVATLAEVATQNSKASSWTAGLNEFSDMTWNEFRAEKLMTPQNCSATHKSTGWTKPAGAPLPDSIDWRDKGALNAIKSQGHCGSCWTFSTTGCLESHHFLKYGVMKNLSEQQLVDCAGAFNNKGCNGGLPSQAYEYIHYNGGLDTEDQYPYTAVTGKTCNYVASPATKVASVVNITAYDEEQLHAAVGTTGPVSIAYQVSADFRNYHSGVYDGVCDTTPDKVNHAVVAVRYGVADASNANMPYFTVRNSWGTTFGEDGYFRIHRGVNKCGISDCASFPQVE
jgi:cathepsin H